MLDINPLIEDNGSEIAYYAIGNHDLPAMVEAIRHYGLMQHGETAPLTRFEFDDNRHKIEARYYRWIPCPKEWDVPYTRRLEPSPLGRGAFVATVVWL